MTPLERAAKAAYEQGEAERSTTFGVDWDDPSLENVRETFLRRTRAILTAIREPSEGMADAGSKAAAYHGEDGRPVWQAMIDAALNEQ